MSNWPPTCSRCGAPMIGGACPRCRAEARPLGGKVVFSGFPGPPSPFVPEAVYPAGTGVGPTVTVPNVVIPPNGMVVVYAGVTGDGSQSTPCTVAWGANSLDSDVSANQYNFNSTIYANTFYYLSPTGGTANVVITNNDPARDLVFGVVNVLVGPVTFRQSWAETHSTSPQSLATKTIIVDLTDLEFHVIWIKDATTDPGVWGGTSSPVPGNGVAITATYGVGYISTACSVRPSTEGAKTTTKAISPAAAWQWFATEFQAP